VAKPDASVHLFVENGHWASIKFHLHKHYGVIIYALRNTKTNKTFLGEEVTDCGPLVDLEKSPDCIQLDDQFDPEGEFDSTEDTFSCCPVFDCPEDAEIVYKNKKGAKSDKSPRKLDDEES